MKRFYECTFIVNPGLDDAQIENTVKTAEDTIVKNGGEIIGTEHIGRRRLAYPIAKKHNGYYVTVEFNADGRIVDKVERFLKLDENVMRYLTLTLDHRELEAKRTRAAFAAQDRGRDQENSNGKKDENTNNKKAEEKKPADSDEKKTAETKEEKKDEAEGAVAEEAAADESSDEQEGGKE